jgi:hypothetical protein
MRYVATKPSVRPASAFTRKAHIVKGHRSRSFNNSQENDGSVAHSQESRFSLSVNHASILDNRNLHVLPILMAGMFPLLAWRMTCNRGIASIAARSSGVSSRSM